jgi:DNA-binding HxlR family transcriptional regulator
MSRQLTPLAMTVLRLLTEDRMHPYEMRQRIQERVYDQVVKVTHGTLYHTVERLAGQGLIEPVETSRDGRRPERTVYAITEKGCDEAYGQLRDYLMRPVDEYPCFGMALAFIRMFGPAEARRLLEHRVGWLEGQFAAHGTIMGTLEKRGLDRVRVLEVEFLQAQRRAEIDFVRALIDDIDDGRLTWRPDQPTRCGGDPANGSWKGTDE